MSIVTLIIPDAKCPACGGKMFGVWISGMGNNHYGKKCDSCNRAYVQYHDPETKRFGLRPATI
ncbi:MAG: hypothetical protein PHW65_06720 [Dehalococcoidales bacterium]|nr:hypothetical protein [Dehalococcoidales bacterium]